MGPVHCPGQTPRCRAAEALISQADAWRPSEHSYRLRLRGAARYRAGNYQEAAAASRKATETRKLTFGSKGTPDYSFQAADAYFLAMAHFQLGAQEEARRWFEQGALWMKDGVPDYPVTQRLHAEAAELLGIELKDPRTGPGK